MNWVIFPIAPPDILSNATSRAIGVLLPSLTNQVFSEVLRGIESVTDAFGYQTMLAHYGYKPEMEEKRLESMLSWNIDGLILTERTHTPRHPEDDRSRRHSGGGADGQPVAVSRYCRRVLITLKPPGR
ncbi:gluconate utilization system Gnt-I transcriptional repressor [Klebsiella pneumoniae]|uniref:Gluconate utilization system Gnt-I transcriptional repressor n=1 Tax=Klebsiella pneumoniae TaxID=573 RepID=A0A378A1T8_KLEPN|nr:gluconate utilization system Gnt-I transcriptional repressor [Klebsiella pneumoniae]